MGMGAPCPGTAQNCSCPGVLRGGGQEPHSQRGARPIGTSLHHTKHPVPPPAASHGAWLALCPHTTPHPWPQHSSCPKGPMQTQPQSITSSSHNHGAMEHMHWLASARSRHTQICPCGSSSPGSRGGRQGADALGSGRQACTAGMGKGQGWSPMPTQLRSALNVPKTGRAVGLCWEASGSDPRA